jgi:transposase
MTKILHPTTRGRPATDARRTWNGIFWIACSRGPWRDLPAEFGKPDTAHRTLRRAALAQRLHRALLVVSDHPGYAGHPLKAIEWFIVRAFRRAFRITPIAIALARRLGLASALPAEPAFLPQPDLSEWVKAVARFAQKIRATLTPGQRYALTVLTELAAGRPRFWRTTA